jgi:DNA-binding NarL/FixJ family response regulator
VTGIRVLIVDDHPLYRRGITGALAGQPGITIVGEVGSATDAIAHCRRHCPDVVLLDINLPDRSGLEVAREIRALCAPTAVLVLTAHDDEAYILALAEVGARGYLLKTATDEEIVAAVRTVATGGAVFAPAVASVLVRRARGEATARDSGLTDRERQVLRWAARGQTNRQIGHALGISERTVQAHLSHIFDKLDVASRTEAVTVALQHDLIHLDEDGG